jgi:hypothetical protein
VGDVIISPRYYQAPALRFLAQGNVMGIFKPTGMKKQDVEVLRKAKIVFFTKCFRATKSRGIKIRTKF